MSIVVLMSSCEQLFTYLRVRLQRALLAVVLVILTIQPTSAHIQSEAPWHAVAYAYLNTLFLLNLEPVDWPLIERVLTTDHDGRILGRPASERLIELDQAAGTAHWQAIEDGSFHPKRCDPACRDHQGGVGSNPPASRERCCRP